MHTFSVKLKLEKETKGAVRYQEVDDDGQPVEFGEAKIGTQYLRKSAFNGNGYPEHIVCTVKY